MLFNTMYNYNNLIFVNFFATSLIAMYDIGIAYKL